MNARQYGLLISVLAVYVAGVALAVGVMHLDRLAKAGAVPSIRLVPAVDASPAAAQDDAALGSPTTDEPSPVATDDASSPNESVEETRSIAWSLTARVTAYSYESCATPACRTRSGTPTRWGVVATDPRVIPLGSRLQIDGFGDTVFSAEDTGGGVRGAWVDVWMPSTAEALRWGSQHREIRVLS